MNFYQKFLRALFLFLVCGGSMLACAAKEYKFGVRTYNYSTEYAIDEITHDGALFANGTEKAKSDTPAGGRLRCCIKLKSKPQPGERLSLDIKVYANRPGMNGSSYFPVKTWAYWPKDEGLGDITVHVYPDWHVELEARSVDSRAASTPLKAEDKPVIGQVVIDPNEKTDAQWDAYIKKQEEMANENHEITKKHAITGDGQ